MTKHLLFQLGLFFPVIQGYSIATYNRHVNTAMRIPYTADGQTLDKTTSTYAQPELVSTAQDTAKTVTPDGPVVGDRYVLFSEEPKQSSGKSSIFEALPHDEDGRLMEECPVIVKLSPNTDALEREAHNYLKITRGRFADEDDNLFVEIHDYLQQADPSCPDLKEHSALVMESGGNDLQNHLQRNGRLEGKELQEAARTAVKCVNAVHKNNMVWTEIKSSNFVLIKDGSSSGVRDDLIKGIDLESAVPHSNPPIDYTAYACPPEFAMEFLCGREAQMPMDYSFDVWSLGMLLYEMSTGTPFFHPDDDNVYVAMTLKNMKDKLDLNKNGEEATLDQDPAMKNVIELCLNMDPRARPSTNQLLDHQYFSHSR